MTCTKNEIYNDLNQITNMNCLKCQKEDNYIQIDSNCFPIITYSNEKIIFDISELNIRNPKNVPFLWKSYKIWRI